MISLTGCTPTPLASYLKALGVLRLLSEQNPGRSIRGAWERGHFSLHGETTSEQLLAFFLDEYAPTPILSPWNGASGFYFREGKAKEKDPLTGKLLKTGVRDQKTAATGIVESISKATSPRFAPLVSCIRTAKSILVQRGLIAAPKEEEKAELLHSLRNRLPDPFVEVLDAAYVLLQDGAKPPPLLGTGLNDGALDFSSNFMQRLTELFELPDVTPSVQSAAWLEHALFGTTFAGMSGSAIGQFNPGATGGPNSSTGFDAKPAMNPWEFILMMEGAILFAAASVKRLESSSIGQLAYPFCVRQSGVGYGSAALSDEENSRCEMWMPLWDKPAGLAELKALLSEGRAQVNGRPARHGVDFARAVASLGVDRGITAFQRYGFQVRNGLSYFATPLERVPVRRNRLATQLLGPLDGWLDQFRRAAHGMAPSSAASAAQRLENAIMAFCKNSDPQRTQEMLIALGRCERAMAGSQKWAQEAFLKPIPLLQPRWLSAADTGTTEYRLAAALAGLTGPVGKTWLPLRCHLEPVAAGRKEDRRWYSWQDNASRDVVWHGGLLPDALNAILARRVVLATRGERLADSSVIPARLGDIASFVEKRTDDRLLASLLWGLCLIDFGAEYGADFKLSRPRDPREPPALYALLKLCFSRHPIRDIEVPLVPAIQRRAAAGDGAGASALAVRRLLGSGLPLAVGTIQLRGDPVHRSAAALLFPLSANETAGLAERVLRPSESQPNTTTE
jgi:CRISPR-associated protein Csx17